MYNYLTPTSLVKKLEDGKEVCGVCGKDVTGQPECIHDNTPVGNGYSDVLKAGSLGIICQPFSLRIGEECLMDLEYLMTLPCLDAYHVKLSSLRWWDKR